MLLEVPLHLHDDANALGAQKHLREAGGVRIQVRSLLALLSSDLQLSFVVQS